MDKDFEIERLSVEEKRWWCRARRDFILKLMNNQKRDCEILVIECAGGYLIKELKEKGFDRVSGIDISEEAVDCCRILGLERVSRMDACRTVFPDNTFDVIIASDVLEHIEGEAAALAEWRRILKGGGRIYVFTPAFGYLWGPHDVRNRHKRRYSSKTLSGALKKAGLKINRVSYWNFFLFFPAVIAASFRKLFRFKSSADPKSFKINPAVNAALEKLIVFENNMLGFVNFPAGVSVFVKAEKPG
jgi:SAM-dependent methyltransferase